MAPEARAAVQPEGLRAAIDRLPRVRLAYLPTPLEEVKNFSAALGGPRIFVKRDDLTGLAFGGNKTRTLEFTIGDARAQGADTVVASAFVQSNHCRQAAAAAAKLGMRAVLVLGSGPDHRAAEPQGNLLLDDLLGAEIHVVEGGSLEEMERVALEHVEKLAREGRKGALVTLGPRPTSLAAVAYTNCVLEMSEQFRALGIRPSAIYVASSGGTQAGLVLGSKALGLGCRVVGLTPIHRPQRPERVAQAANAAAKLLGLRVEVVPDDIPNYDDYVGPGYGVLTAEATAAIRLLASTEGIILDPSYTGKALAGLIDHVRKGLIGPDETVVFLHTGGTPALFAYHRELVATIR